jgi:hypothetical protein
MMKLKALIAHANRTYELGLDPNGRAVLYNRMRTAGHASEVTAKVTGHVLDAMLSIADGIEGRKPPPRSVYASLKVEAAPPLGAEDACPRCKDTMKSVNLVGGRAATYCEPCHITLPLRVE